MSQSFDDYRALQRGLPELAEKIAAELGDGWKAVDANTEYYGKVVGPDGAVLLVGVERDAAKVSVRGHYPDTAPHGVEHHEIGVSLSRGVSVIAKEVKRRLLPAYLPDLVKAYDALARSLTGRYDQRVAADAIAAEFPDAYRRGDERFYVGGCDVEVSFGGHVRLTCRDTDVETAIAVLRLHRKEGS